MYSYDCLACGEGQFKCHNTDHCIPASLVCDTRDDCGDWSDENCGELQFSITAFPVVVCSVPAAYVCIIKSTPASRPNNIRGGNVLPSLGPRGLRPSVRPISMKFDLFIEVDE